tara:strand:+ start:2052 stop:2186 length:135 start_codon:yes stop_codon:yes gene_type:complete
MEEKIKCDCGRVMNLTDWHYGKCIICLKALDIPTWKKLGGMVIE